LDPLIRFVSRVTNALANVSSVFQLFSFRVVCGDMISKRFGLVAELRLSNYIIRKYVLPIWSEHNYMFSHRVVHWVYNYMFRPCILAILRFYCKFNTATQYVLVVLWEERDLVCKTRSRSPHSAPRTYCIAAC
jgi:hypothetical protein